MNTLKIEINTDNDAFEDGELTNQLRLIFVNALWDLNVSLDQGQPPIEIGLFDSNGNYVGTLTYK